MSIFGKRNNVITYTVNKATNRDMYITIQNGEVIVNAPWYFTQNKIQAVVEEKKNWILSKINEYQQQINYQQSVNDQLNQITQSTPIEQPINKLQLLKEQRDNETFEIEQMFLLKNKAQNEKSFNEFMNSSHIDLMTSSIDTSIENMLNNTNIQN